MLSRPERKRSRVWDFALLLPWFFSAAAAAQAVPAPQSNPSQSVQDQPAHSGSDLSAAAKQAREERAHQRAQRSANSEAVNEMAAELSEASDQPIAGAPVGYRYYMFKPGNYAILVPVDAKPEGRDSYGLRLFSTEALSSRTELILGDPIPAQGDTPEEILHNATARYFSSCGWSLTGLAPPVNGHPALSTVGFGQCLNHQLEGGGEFVLADGYVMPVICGYPLTTEDLTPNPHAPIKKILNKYDRERNGYRVCDIILPSLRFDPHGKPAALRTASAPVKTPTVTSALLPLSASANATPAEASLGAFARAHKKASSVPVLTELRHAAPGYRSHSFRYCNQDRCYSASIQVPAKAKENDGFRLDYIGLFEFDVPIADTVAVIQADTGPPSESGFISREEIIRTKVDWALQYVPGIHFSGAGKAEVFGEELTELSGIPARLATFRSPTALEPVITHLAAYLVPGKFVQIRCSVPEKASGDAQAMCEHVVHSMEIPGPKQQRNADSDDPPTPEDNEE